MVSNTLAVSLSVLCLVGAVLAAPAPEPIMKTFRIRKKCDPSTVNLADYEAWRREAGYWIGDYVFLGSDGKPFESAAWNYPYDDYKGFIILATEGNRLSQRNVFLYPPQKQAVCESGTDSAVGEGACGVNGNEKIYFMDQEASDCQGNLAGPYYRGGLAFDSTTTIIGDDTVLYRVSGPQFQPFNGSIIQNQLTTLPSSTFRVRTAQSYSLGQSTAASYYRERKVSKEEFFSELTRYRQEYNILESDWCAWDQSNQPSGTNCEDFFASLLTPPTSRRALGSLEGTWTEEEVQKKLSPDTLAGGV